LETSLGTKTHRFFAEDLNLAPIEVSSIPFELYAHELQRIDTTNENSVKSFCERYGLILAPNYDSKRRSMYDRNRKESDDYLWPTVYSRGIESVRMGLAWDCYKFPTEIDTVDGDITNYLVDMFEGSSLARGAVVNGDYANQHLGGIVSVREVAFTIRQLQVATALLTAYSAGLRGNELMEYLANPKHMQQKCPDEFKSHGYDVMFGVWLDYNSEALLPVTPDRAIKLANEAYSGKPTDKQIQEILEWLELLQAEQIEKAVRLARDYVSATKSVVAAENAGIRGIANANDIAMILKEHTCRIEEGSLIEAIVSSLDFVLSAKQDWIACKHCGKIFKFYKEYKPRKRYKPAVFCKNSCRVLDNDKPAQTE
jgi:hypothetical protein